MELKSSEARLVVLNGAKTSYAHINVKPRKLVLGDDEEPDEVRAFRDSLYAFLRVNGIELVAIKKRGKTGDYAGGPVSFKLEAITQLCTDCRIVLVAPQTIAAALRNHPTLLPKDLPQYQQSAFEVAYTALPA